MTAVAHNATAVHSIRLSPSATIQWRRLRLRYQSTQLRQHAEIPAGAVLTLIDALSRARTTLCSSEANPGGVGRYHTTVSCESLSRQTRHTISTTAAAAA